MLESNWNTLFQSLAESQVSVSLVVTGGGSGALKHCFGRVGASRQFVEATIPYSRAALVDYLGGPPKDSSASAPVAKQLAAVALDRACRLRDDQDQNPHPVGIALVAALPTSPPRRGQDRIHVALLSQETLHAKKRGVLWSLALTKDAYTREEAESIAEEMVRLALFELCESESDDSFFRAAQLIVETSRYDG